MPGFQTSAIQPAPTSVYPEGFPALSAGRLAMPARASIHSSLVVSVFLLLSVRPARAADSRAAMRVSGLGDHLTGTSGPGPIKCDLAHAALRPGPAIGWGLRVHK